MNAFLVPAGLPVYCVHTSNPSIPNHFAAPATAFAFVHALSLLVAAGQWTKPPRGGLRSLSFQGLGQGFAQRSQARRSARPNRVHVVSCLPCSRCYGRVVHFRQLSTSCCHDAVAFGFRRVNVPPGGDFHPAVCTPSQAHERRLPVGLARSPFQEIGSRLTLGRMTALSGLEIRAPEWSTDSRSPTAWTLCGQEWQ